MICIYNHALHFVFRFISKRRLQTCLLFDTFRASMDTDKRMRNSSTNTAFAAYGNWNVEEGNDYSLQLETKDTGELIGSAYLPNLSDASSFSFSSSSSSEPLDDFSELLAQLPIK